MALSKTPPSVFTTFFVYSNYVLLIIFGHLRDFYRSYFPDKKTPKTLPGYAPIFKSFENFYTRRVYTRIRDCWSRPISSAPSAYIDVMERYSNNNNKTYVYTKKSIRCLNLGSYNYLGFAESPKHVKDAVLNTLDKYGVSTCSSVSNHGRTVLHKKLEEKIANFVGHEDAIVVGMGFATNSLCIPAISCKGTLIISDSLNHASIVVGAKSCNGAKVMVFKHNDVSSLENIIRTAIVEGQPKTHRPWKKIIIIIEGIYSMEGEVCKLKEIVELKKKYKCYLYVDEAHSIGALGPNGKGVCDYWGVNPKDVDVLMGTFTKSFGSVGGYIASSKKMIGAIKKKSWANLYTTSLSPSCVQQIISALDVITGEDGTDIGKIKLKQLRDNSNFLKDELIKRGFEVIGDKDSPIVCAMFYNPTKISAFSRLCLSKGLAVVVVGSPATDIVGARARFCLSSGHTIEDLKKAIEIIDDAGDMVWAKYLA